MPENFSEHLWKSLVISENVWKSLKTPDNYYFNSQTIWKTLLALLIAEWFSTNVLSTFYELYLRKSLKEKENKLTIRTKKHISSKNL